MSKRRAQPYDGPTVLGVDTSRWQERDGDSTTVDVDYPEMRAEGARFAVVRTGDGTQTTRKSRPDPVAVVYAQAAAAADLLVAFYHYMRGCLSGAEQAEIALEVIRRSGVRPGFLAIDVEGAPAKIVDGKLERPASGAWRDVKQKKAEDRGITTEELLEQLLAFVLVAQAAEIRVIVYGGAALHWYLAQRREELPPWLAVLPLWLAQYRKVPHAPTLPSGAFAWPPWVIWQYTGKGTVDGDDVDEVGEFRGDMNRFRGDEAELEKWWFDLPDTIPPSAPTFDREEILRLSDRAKNFDDRDAALELLEAYERLGKGGR